MAKFVKKQDLDSMMKVYCNSEDNLRIIIEKNCGYNFLVVLPPKATMRDLSRYVELIYSHVEEPISLYYGEIYVNNQSSDDVPVNNEQKNESVVNNETDVDKRCECCKLKTNSGKKHYIKPNDILITKFISDNKITPCTKVPERVYYKFYLDLCKK